jgi:hypothetical protein
MVFPVTVGRGRRLFRDGTEKTGLTLTDVKATGTGVALLTYSTAVP